MRLFDEIDPLTIDQHPNLVSKLADDRNPNRSWYLLVVNDFCIISTVTYKERKHKWLHYQIEFPKQGLQWFLDTLRDKFFKTEAEGGLPKGKFHDETSINGERLMIGRAFNADGNRGGVFILYARQERKLWFSKRVHLYR